MSPRKITSRGKGHRFGGDWTAAKLEVVAEYLKAYTTALKGTSFKTAYIDAFAGTGYRSMKETDGAQQLLEPLAEDAPQKLLDGSARMALKTAPRFHRYIVVERHAARAHELARLGDEFPHLAANISVGRDEANRAIQALRRKDWSQRRAVLFLDPYGMQVEWATIEAIAGTRAIDLWLLCPLGIGVNRLLTRSGDIPESWRRRLDIMLGTKDWYEEFYKVEKTATLFDDEVTTVVKASTQTIGRYFNRRLEPFSLE
jgi:three-Cys-motif partner protein